jgi:1-deoxy-D-xylulose 5-phosphate reductoisomerase
MRFKLAIEGISMRLGDMIDDHCSRCKRTTDHAIVAMTGDDVVKVVCRTCNSEHKYRHNKTGKKEMTAEQAFQQVLASVTGQMGESSAGAAKKKKN